VYINEDVPIKKKVLEKSYVKGNFLTLMRSWLPTIEVVRNLSSSSEMLESIQTLVDGKVDLSPDSWGVTYQGCVLPSQNMSPLSYSIHVKT
jgi:hypothetical protein